MMKDDESAAETSIATPEESAESANVVAGGAETMLKLHVTGVDKYMAGKKVRRPTRQRDYIQHMILSEEHLLAAYSTFIAIFLSSSTVRMLQLCHLPLLA